MRKAEALEHWRALPDGAPIIPHMKPIPYKSEGSTYGACGIRIDGNPAFVDAVLGRLKDMLVGENTVTRLGLCRRPVTGDFKPCHNRDEGSEVCYIRLHMRGPQSASRTGWGSTEQERANTELFAAALGVGDE